ncbi:membrane protein [Thiomicrorhabdus hydrogeniphila]
MSEETPVVPPESPKAPVSTTIPMAIYILYLVNFVLPFAGLVGVIMAYINKGDAADFLKSHYQFQIRTFWIGLLYVIVGALLTMVLIGWLVLLFYVVWLIVRCVKGLKYLGKQEAMPEPTSWMFG